MNKLVNSLLTLARVEGLNLQTSKQSFDMAALVCDVMRSMKRYHHQNEYRPQD